MALELGTRPPTTDSSGGESGVTIATLTKIGGRESPFATSEFLNRDGRTRNRHGETVAVPEQKRAFSPELQESFYESTRGELEHMMREWDRDPVNLRQMLEYPDYHPYKILFERFTEQKAGSGSREGNIGMITVKDKELKDYLKTDAGMADAYEIRRIRMEEVALNSGSFLDSNLGQVPPQPVDNIDTTVAPGGWANELFTRRFGGWLKEPRESHGRRTTPDRSAWGNRLSWRGRVKADSLARGAAITTTTGVVGVLLAGPLGAAAGAAIPPAVLGIYESFKRGEHIDLNKAQEALRVAQADAPVKREFAKRMWNVDVTNLGIDRFGKVGIRAGINNNTELASPSAYFKSVQEFLMQEASQIREAEAAMSQRPELLAGGMDTQGFREDGRGQFSARDASLDTQVNTQVARLIRDGLRGTGNPNMIQILATGEWVRNPAFNLGTVDQDYRFRLRRGIHRKLLSERMHDNINKSIEAGTNRRGRLEKTITDRKGAHGPNSEAARERREEITEEQTLLGAESTNLEGANTEITSYQEYLRTQRQAIEQHEDTIRRQEQEIDIIDPVPPPPGYVHPANIQEALRRITDNPGETFQLRFVNGDENISSLIAMSNGIDRNVESDYNTWNTNEYVPNLNFLNATLARATDETVKNQLAGQIANLRKQAEDKRDELKKTKFRDRIKRYEAMHTLVSDARTVLREESQKLHKARVDLTSRFEEHRRPVESTINSMNRARRDIEDWGNHATITAAPAPPDLSTNALATENFTTLQARMNEVYQRAMAATPPVPGMGWPDTENNNPTNRQRLLDAMAEARAVRIEPRINAPTPIYNRATNASTFGFSELDLVALSDTEIQQRMSDMIASATAAGALSLPIPLNPDQIVAVRAEAQSRLSARQRALREVHGQVTERNTELTQEDGRIGREGLVSQELAAYERAVGRYDEVGRIMMDMTTDELLRGLNTDPASSQPRLHTAAEQENNHSIAYANMMQWMFDHRDSSQDAVEYGGQTGRDAAFRRNSEALNEDMLRDLLLEGFPRIVRPPVGVTPTFEQVVNNLRALVAAGGIRQRDFSEFFQQTVIFNRIAPRVPVL